MASFRATFSTEQNLNAQFGDNGLNLRTGFGDVIEAPGSVRYDIGQELSAEDQARARENIGVDVSPILEMNVTNLELLDGVFSYLFTATNVSSREELAVLNPALVRLHWDGALLLTPPFRKSITGTVRRNAEDWSSYTLDFGELGRLNNAGARTVRIPMDFFAYFTATTADPLTLRAWAQTFDAAAQAQMRSNIGAASDSDLTAHTGDTTVHVTAQDKTDWSAKYDKPAGGIPMTDLSENVQNAIDSNALFIGTASFTGTTDPVTFTLNKSSNELLEAMIIDPDAREQGLCGVFFGDNDGFRVAVPVFLTPAALLGITWGATFTFAPNAISLQLAFTRSDDPMTVTVPAAIMDAVFNPSADVDQLVRTTAQSFGSTKKAQARTNIGAGTYSKPTTGIPESDLANAVKNKINNAATSADLTAHTSDSDIHVTASDKTSWSAKYDKPGTGIPKTDLASGVQDSLDAADAAMPGSTKVVQYDAQTLQTSEKQQARQNIGAARSDDTTNEAARLTAAIPFGQVDSTSTATVFTATVPGITALRNGVCVMLMNGVVTSASGWTLNINNLGAKPVYQTMAAASRVTTLWNVNYTMLFVYNEDRVTDGCWDMYYGYNSNDNTIAYNVRSNNTAGLMNSQLYRYEMLFTLPDGTLEPANNVSNKPTTYTKALTTESFNPFEPIYYYATTTAVAAGAAPGASYCWTQYSGVDLRYSFNEGSTLTAYKATYLRCTPQGDCLVKLDGNDCVVQALPSTEDGKVYIYLGKTYSTYQIWMSQNHPIYEYKGGKLKLWDGTI